VKTLAGSRKVLVKRSRTPQLTGKLQFRAGV
jgi:hypothetical protein